MDPLFTRFLKAQEQSYNTALGEISDGKKATHWMWFIFPQLTSLGKSETAKYYGIENLEEATAYLQHPVLGNRLLEISKKLLTIKGKTANEIMGSPDDLKLRSSMTLFALIKDADPIFKKILDMYFDGVQDEQTINFL